MEIRTGVREEDVLKREPRARAVQLGVPGKRPGQVFRNLLAGFFTQTGGALRAVVFHRLAVRTGVARRGGTFIVSFNPR